MYALGGSFRIVSTTVAGGTTTFVAGTDPGVQTRVPCLYVREFEWKVGMSDRGVEIYAEWRGIARADYD